MDRSNEEQKAVEQMQKSVSGLELMRVAERLVQAFWEFGGVVDDLIENEMEEFFGDASHKLDQYRYVREALTVKKHRLRKRAQEMTESARRFDREIRKVEKMALGLIETACELDPSKRKWTSDHGSVYMSTREKLKIEDPDAFLEKHQDDDRLVITEVVRKIDRQSVLARLKSGEQIEGARLVESPFVTFR